MSVFPPGDPRNANSPPGIQWMSDPSDTEKIARLERDLLAANLHAAAVKAERDEVEKDIRILLARIEEVYGSEMWARSPSRTDLEEAAVKVAKHFPPKET